MQPSPLPSPLPDVFPSYPSQCWATAGPQCNAAADTADEVIADISGKIIGQFTSCMDSCEEVLGQCCGCIHGCFERAISESERLCGTLSDKIQARLVSLMSESYGWSASCGLPIPTNQEVALGIGLKPPVSFPPDTPITSVLPSPSTGTATGSPSTSSGSATPSPAPHPQFIAPIGGTISPIPTPPPAPPGYPPPGTIPACGQYPKWDDDGGECSGATGGTPVPSPSPAPTGSPGASAPCPVPPPPWSGCGSPDAVLGALAVILRQVLTPTPCGDDRVEIPTDGIGTRVAGPLPKDAYRTKLYADTPSCGDKRIFGDEIGHWYGWYQKDKDGLPWVAIADSLKALPFNTTYDAAYTKNKTVKEIFADASGEVAYCIVFCSEKPPEEAKPTAPSAPTTPPPLGSLKTADDWAKLWSMMRLPDWGDRNVCETVRQLVSLLDNATTGGLSLILGLKDSSGKDTTPDWLSAIMGSDSFGIGKTLAAVARFAVSIQDAELKAISSFLPCSVGSVYLPTLLKVLIGALKNWIGGDYHQIEESLDYLFNSACQTEIPGTGEVDEGYLTNQFTKEQWECLTKANGHHLHWRRLLLAGKRHKLSPEDAYRLWARGLVTDTWAKDYFRQDGWTENYELEDKWRLMEEKPGPADIIRFMVRNAADEELAKEWGADREFDVKFTDKLAAWALEHGVSKDTMLYHWRAHWLEASPGQLYTMLQRLRPGRVEKGLVTDKAMVYRGLGANDWHPVWRDRLVAISYRVMTRVDARRAFNSGTIDAKELAEIYQDQGYDEKTAAQLVDFTAKQKDAGAKSNRWIRLYAKGGVRRAETVEKAMADGLSESAVNDALDYVDAEQAAAATRACVKAVRARFMAGELDYAQAVDQLHQLPLDNGQVVTLAGQWRCERAAKPKVATAAMLCKWRTAGLITAEDYRARLVAIGWNADDATRIAGLCETPKVRSSPRTRARGGAAPGPAGGPPGMPVDDTGDQG